MFDVLVDLKERLVYQLLNHFGRALAFQLMSNSCILHDNVTLTAVYIASVQPQTE